MIWVVAEDQTTSDQLTHLINRRGYPTLALDWADDVPQRLRFQQPPIVIIDCSIKGSFDLISAIRSDPLTRAVPLVVFAAAPDDGKLEAEAMTRGANAFIPKRTLDWAELLDAIARHAGPPPEESDDSAQEQ